MRHLFALIVASFLIACSDNSSNNVNAADSQSNNATPSSTEPQETIELKLAHAWPTDFPLFGTSVNDYAELVAEMSDCLLYTSDAADD